MQKRFKFTPDPLLLIHRVGGSNFYFSIIIFRDVLIPLADNSMI